MAYIGKTPVIGNFQVCDAISVVNNQAAYTMQVGGVNVSPESANHMIVSLNGVIQKPTDAFTVSSSTITFASNLVTGDVIDFIQILGNVLDLGVPSDSTVSLAKLTATGTKDATTFLRGDNTFQTVSSYTDSDALTLFNASGSTPVYACRAWCSFNGIGTPAILGSGNISSITDQATGKFRLNFATAFPDIHYACAVNGAEDGGSSYSNYGAGVSITFYRVNPAATVNNVSCETRENGATNRDLANIQVSIFR